MTKSSLRKKLGELPVLGYLLRVGASVSRLPRTDRIVISRLDQQQNNLQSLHEQYDALRKDILDAHEVIGDRLNQLDTLETKIRLADGKLADIAHEVSTLKTGKHKPHAATPASATGHQPESTLLADDHTLDQFYIEFENKFRGKEADIKKRLEIYLPYFKAAKKSPKHPTIDIGCGRGEFLKLLKEHDIPAKGLDLNESMVKRAKEQGLDVVQADAMQYLHEMPSNSAYAVTGFHLVEHIPFAALLRLMDECYRAIQPGGYAIFETPNPENVIVGSHNFYHDPSHLNPIPPALLAFVMETRGFSNVKIKRLHPMETNFETEDPLVLRIAERMYGPSDYAVVAQK